MLINGCPECAKYTGGCPQHAGVITLPAHGFLPPMTETIQRGWLCPVCGEVNAPWMATCAKQHGGRGAQGEQG